MPSRAAGATATVVAALVALAGCGSAEERAESEARQVVIEKLDAVEHMLSAQLMTFDPADADDVATWVPSTYRHSVAGQTLTLEFGVRGVGRDDRASLGETVVPAGACFRVVGGREAATIRQVGCPRSFLRAFGEAVEVQVRVIDSERPLAAGDE